MLPIPRRFFNQRYLRRHQGGPLVPVCVLVLYLGCRRSSATTSDSDLFAYHMGAAQLIWCLGSAFTYGAFFTDLPEMMAMGGCLQYMALQVEGLLHVLTCVERYLAVVQPITYLGLRNGRGVMIRNISVSCVWLLAFAWSCIANLLIPSLAEVSLLFFLPVSTLIVSFCSLSVLHVLIRSGPGEVGGRKARVDQSKRRAFHTVSAIAAVLLFWVVGAELLGLCAVKSLIMWFSLPSSLVLPLMFLHRAEKLPCCSYESC
ncbi:uncharacterized protein ACO6RY_03062 [Pungitius sinensis]